MRKEQMIEIAIDCFFDSAKKDINIKELSFAKLGYCYYLYEKGINNPSNGAFLAIVIDKKEGFVQIESFGKQFNHYLAIKMLEKYYLI